MSDIDAPDRLRDDINRQIFLAFVIDEETSDCLRIPLDILAKLNENSKPDIIGAKDEMQILLESTKDTVYEAVSMWDVTLVVIVG